MDPTWTEEHRAPPLRHAGARTSAKAHAGNASGPTTGLVGRRTPARYRPRTVGECGTYSHGLAVAGLALGYLYVVFWFQLIVVSSI